MVNTEGSGGTDPVIPLNAASRQSDSGGDDPLHCDDVAPSDERAGIRRGIYLLPNLVTTGALFSGFYAIIAAMTDRLESAAIAIVIAGFLDALDGRCLLYTSDAADE